MSDGSFRKDHVGCRRGHDGTMMLDVGRLMSEGYDGTIMLDGGKRNDR